MMIIMRGVQIGIIIALPISGLLSSAPLGWELVYYSLAMLALSMAIISGTLTASSPGDHQAKEIKRPWREILKSLRFWVVASAHASSNAIFVFFIVHTPSYLMTYGMSLENLINLSGAFGIVMGLTVLPNFPREWSCPAILVVTAILALLGFQFCGFL
ncbi:hypothetical protein HF086_013487, partial [Spodoptera exigua]